MNVKRIIFIRPGETDWNRQSRQQGWVAAPLDARGVQQAEKLAKVVPSIGVGALYSSDLVRAKQTAEIVANRLGLTPTFDERLRERAVGEWQGLTLDEIRDWYPREHMALQYDPDHFCIPGGESRMDVQKRVKAALADILPNAPCETIAIISHTTAIRMSVCLLVPGKEVNFNPVANTSVTTLARDQGDAWRVVAADDTLHLEGLESTAVTEPEDD
ncbi:MAG: histidine phosphatase family protein [Anaerolineae bacterium]|nr:histidine phosphatase family protein [Anaerolineae bacterium]